MQVSGSPSVVTTSNNATQITPSVSVPAGSTDTQVQAAINAVVAAGGGTVQLFPGIYSFNNPVTLASNISIIGVPTSFPPQNGILNNQWILSGGTIIQPGPNGPANAFIANASDLPDSSAWPAGLISGLVMENLAFQNFTGAAIKIGAKNAAGLTQSRLRRLAFYNCGSQFTSASVGYAGSTFALELRNPGESNISEIYTAQCLGGGLAIWANTTANDQTGNCVVKDVSIDLTSVVGSNNCRAIAVGIDPAAAANVSQPINEMRLQDCAVYAGAGRSSFSDTATFSGTTSIAVTNASRYPVGMPVQFSGGTGFSGLFRASWTYFVLSNNGSAITVGYSRGGSALTTGSGTSTIYSTGFPIFDIGGPLATGSSSAVTSMQLVGVDCEGYQTGSIALIYLENVAGLFGQINQITDAHATTRVGNIVMRTTQSTNWISSASAIAPDIDYSFFTNNSQLAGIRRPGNNSNVQLVGFGYDASVTAYGVSVNPQVPDAFGTTSTWFDLYTAGTQNTDHIYPNRAIGTKVRTVNGTTAIGYGNGYGPGFYSCEQSASQTLTLPALGNSSVLSSTKGFVYEFVNIGAGAVTIKPSANASGQYINNTSTLTNNQVTLAAPAAGVAQWAKFVGQVTGGGVTYWAVETTGTIS